MLFLFTPVARRKASSAAATKPCPAVPLWDREHAPRAFDAVARLDLGTNPMPETDEERNTHA
ncbi:hypothetical protein [Streptomyces niveiscabiei]|uniref:Uncharacterized protein n=1 Tax=Streptomyces niveiscabiei TaxID=164115 RepID=A0ABW9HZ39_9ACTN